MRIMEEVHTKAATRPAITTTTAITTAATVTITIVTLSVDTTTMSTRMEATKIQEVTGELDVSLLRTPPGVKRTDNKKLYFSL
jgi:hypothetical protein